MERLSALWRAYSPCGEPIPLVESLFPLWRAYSPCGEPIHPVESPLPPLYTLKMKNMKKKCFLPPTPQVQFLMVLFVGGVAHFETYGPPPSLMVHHAALVAEGRGFESPCPPPGSIPSGVFCGWRRSF